MLRREREEKNEPDEVTVPAEAELQGCLQVGQVWILGMTCRHHISLEMAWIQNHILTPTVIEHCARGFIFLLRT